MTLEHPQMNITADVDVTELRAFCKREGCSFFLAFMHIVALAADSIPQFRQRIHRLTADEQAQPEHAGAPKNGPLAGIEIREYAESPTSNTEPCGDDMYCYSTNRHHMPWPEYIRTATERQRAAREKGSLEEDPEIEGFYFPTCLPWIHYREVCHPMTDRYDSNPRFSWGKFEEDWRGRLMMPLTVAAHHGLVDGLQVGRFYETVERMMGKLVRGEILAVSC